LTASEALNTLDELTPVRYNYKVEKDEEYIGFIAEDVPDLVAMSNRKGLSPMDITAVLTKVVKEQKNQIEGLKNENEAKDAEIESLRNEINKIKAVIGI